MVQFDCGGCGNVLDYHHDVTVVTETEERQDKFLFWETTVQVENVVGYECTYCEESIPRTVAEHLGKQYAMLGKLSKLDGVQDAVATIRSEVTNAGGESGNGQ
jgi:hypothetical protein